ncbi:mitochondrial splicing system protein [Coniosporium tulheliwenetii]|uniref:Mitochondrial splicing system protein n=1 Tax=Coniosporium tulheliwenetii TaxID=3383036 RepID=A0ACC2Z3S9_9PEZI|nr:mitochondrial splicing system protein [Cladosporium sp. JES 115]
MRAVRPTYKRLQLPTLLHHSSFPRLLSASKCSTALQPRRCQTSASRLPVDPRVSASQGAHHSDTAFVKASDSGSEPTIYALSTTPGRAAIAVIRVSGPACVEIYHGLCPSKPLPKPRFAALRTLNDPTQPPSKDSILDPNALLLHFPSPRTVTGEDVLELHVHGGPAIVKAVLAAIPRCATSKGRVRYAEPGEFTRRAFLNGRMDLTQVEALGDTLSATTEQQRRVATPTSLRAGELEALIDFSEDQHFDESPAVLAASVAAQVSGLRKQLEAHRVNAVRGELLREGISIALLGAPNSGKSSLLNRIVGREAAIVSHEAGTTRDVVEVGVDIGGWYCRFGDMAGLRKSLMAEVVDANGAAANDAASGIVGAVEQEGIRRAKQRALESDVVIVMTSIEGAESHESASLYIDPEVEATARECHRNGAALLVVVNKTDKIPEGFEADALVQSWRQAMQRKFPISREDQVFFISCKEAVAPSLDTADPGNIQQFLKGLISVFAEITAAVVPDLEDNAPDPSIWQESLGATERHRLLLEDCIFHLDNFLAEVQASSGFLEHSSGGDLDVVVAAESLRAAADCLAKITGKGQAGDVEEVLGVVFEK